jgi:hypothetical protein
LTPPFNFFFLQQCTSLGTRICEEFLNSWLGYALVAIQRLAKENF